MKAIIAGVGFTGLAVARVFKAAGWDVLGLTHSPDSAAALAAELPAMACDISSAESTAGLAASAGAVDAIIHCASSSRGGEDAYRAVYLNGARNLRAAFPSARLLFTSSTSVYAQTDGGWVTEESPAEPPRETGRILRQTEDEVASAGGIVARLAGIYGPGRSVLLRKFFSGEAVIEGDGSRVINQIHRDDIATALLALLQSRASGIYNVSDDGPITQRELYEWLARHFGRPLPPTGPIDTNRKRGWTSKKVSNARLRALGWTPRWPRFFDAVEGDPALVSLAQ